MTVLTRYMPQLLRSLVVLALAAARLHAQEDTLKVLRHTPGDTASPGNIVTVMFDRPVAGRLDATTDAGRIFHIEPATPGKVAWRDPITIRFIPDEPLPPGATFAVTIDTGFSAIDGSKLAAPYRFSFRVPGPRLLVRSYRDYSARNPDQLRYDGKVQLLYSAPVDLGALARRLRVELTDCDGKASLAIAMRPRRQRPLAKNEPWPLQDERWDRDTVADRFRRVVELEPARPFPPDCTGQLVLPNTTDDAMHGAEERFAVRTAPSFHLLSFDCTHLVRCSPTTLALEFTAPVKRADARRYVHLEPRVPFEFAEGPEQALVFQLKVRLAPRSTYRLAVDGALHDIYDRQLELPRQALLDIGDYAPAIGYPRGILTMPRSGDLTIPVRHVNVREIRIINFAIPDSVRSRILAVAPLLMQIEVSRLWRYPAETTVVALTGDHNAETVTQVALPASVMKKRLVAIRMEISRRIIGPGPDSVQYVHGSPPRYYSLWDESPYAILQTTDLAAHVKIAPGEGTVLVTGLVDGTPRPNASVRQLDDSGRVTAEGITGVDGVAVFRLPDRAPVSRKPISNDWPLRVGVVEVSLADDRVVLPLSRRALGYEAHNPLEVSQLGASPGAVPAATATLFADRDIYRPGEMLYLEGIVRDGPLGALRPPPARDSVRAKVTYRPSPWDRRDDVVVHDTVLTSNRYGTVTDSFRLRAGASVGSYAAELSVWRSGAWQVVATELVRVAEYRAPEFLIALAADSGSHRGGDTLRVRVKGKYLFGAPMGKAAVQWTASLREATPWEVKIPGAEGWTVGAWDWVASRETTEPHWLSGAVTLDASGEQELRIPVLQLRPSRPGRVAVEVAVTDINRQVVTAGTEIAVHATDLYVLARHRSSAWYWTSGEPGTIELRTVRPDGSPVTGVAVAVSVVRRSWKEDPSHGYGGRWVDDTLRRDTVQSAAAPTAYSFVPTGGGWYEFRLTVADGRGGIARTTIGAYVLGAGDRYAVGSPFHLAVLADRGQQEVGSVARVVFDSPFDDADGWITVEREGVIDQRHVAIHRGSNVVTLPITDRYVPNVFVGVLLLDHRSPDAARPDSAAQVIRVGFAELHVKTTSKRLSVAVVPDERELRPAQSSSVQVRVRDAAGRGVHSDVTVWAVDEGVLALTGYSTPDVLARMYAPRGLGVGLWSTLPTVVTSDPGLVVELMRRQAALLMAAVTAAGNGPVEVVTRGANAFRTQFRSTAFFAGSAITNAAGVATIRVRVPDNLTTFRLMAVAVSADDRFGSADSSFLVTRPLVARSALPRFVRPSDSFVAGAAVNARDGLSHRVAADATTDGIYLQGQSHRDISLDPGRGGEARFSFRAPSRDSIRDTVVIRLHASDGTNADGVETRLPVKPDFHPRTHVAVGLVRDSTSVVLALPSDIDAGRSRLSLRIGTSPLPAMLAAYDWLRVYPYDCSEQIASLGRVLLAVWGATHHDTRALGDDPRPRLLALAEELSRRQRADGGIRYWYDYDWSSPWLSAYAGFFLLDAREAGIPVDSTTLVRLGAYLARFAALPIDTGGMNRFERQHRRLALGERVMIVEYLRRLGKPDVRAEDELLTLAPLMTWEDRLHLAEVLAPRADVRNAAVALVDAAWRAVTPAGRRVDLPDSVYTAREFPSRVAPVARLLTATLALRPEHPLLGGVIESVLELGRAEGRWAWSTQDYTATVLALAALPQTDGSTQRVVVRAHDRDVLARRVGSVDSTSAVPLTGLLERGPGGTLQLRLRLTSDGKRGGAGTYFAVSVEEVPSKPPVTPDVNGIVVERWYERFDDGRPVTAVQAGDLVRVRLRVTVPADRAFVAVEDPLPAGLEPVDVSLRTSATLGPFVTPESQRAQRAGDRDRDGPRWQSWLYGRWDDGWWSPWEHKELRDDKVVYFARMLWTGSYTASYVARATTTGTFVRPPAHAEEMYNPGVRGRSDGGRFDVLEAKP